MQIEALSDDFVDELLSSSPVKAKYNFSKTCECGWVIENGYCPNPECEWDAVEETVFCQHCGNCTDPEHCVWGIQCSQCYAPPHQHCLDDRGSITGLHEQRWKDAGATYK